MEADTVSVSGLKEMWTHLERVDTGVHLRREKDSRSQRLTTNWPIAVS